MKRTTGKKRVKVKMETSFLETTKNYKTYKVWFDEEKYVNKKRLIKQLVSEFGLKPYQAGLIVSWSIKDQITVYESYNKYRFKFLKK